MIELVKDHHATTRQTWPEVLERRADNFIDPAIGKNKFELKVGVLHEKLFEMLCDIEVVYVNNVIQSLRLD